ncbi:hypothetical protein JTY93_04625 [Pseudomonas hygromyciniae]|uniref:Uncharacterized protein n=1 Tax=Pseudomonas hygromyciniae TaxID=2812000 RepID=A0ABX7JZ68_9PSED|nr:hypothetical protein [Pseudomonas hygromyciniae]MBN0979810.1 hypothetical protein [Pseudomonas hygromyciniae]QSB40682.1 hypothetical protein JTY93_04625 [Pseudomonas hygromyciniae]
MGVVEEVFSGLIAGHKKAGLQNKPGTIKGGNWLACNGHRYLHNFAATHKSKQIELQWLWL